jgi:prophage antirepressor-like protein/phage anti-repressor protein
VKTNAVFLETAIAFSFGGNLDVRVLRREGRNWFVAVDVCAALGLGDCQTALAGIDDSQKSTAVLEKEPSGPTELTVVDEAGLRALIRAGQNPKAVQEFRRWVATELLLSLERMSMPPSVPGRTSEQRNPIHESGATTAEAPLWNGPLIPVFTATIGGIEHLVFNARDLHGFLGSRDKFADWIKDQFKRARLKEHRHYGVFRKIPNNSTKGGRPGVEYHLTMDAAKHIAMIANTDKAFEQPTRAFPLLGRRPGGGHAP